MERPEQITISIGRQFDGVAFELHPRTAMWLEEVYPDVSRPSQVFIGHRRSEDFDALRDDLVTQIVVMLTGLDEATIRELGGFRIYDPAARQYLQAAR